MPETQRKSVFGPAESRPSVFGAKLKPDDADFIDRENFHLYANREIRKQMNTNPRMSEGQIAAIQSAFEMQAQINSGRLAYTLPKLGSASQEYVYRQQQKTREAQRKERGTLRAIGGKWLGDIGQFATSVYGVADPEAANRQAQQIEQFYNPVTAEDNPLAYYAGGGAAALTEMVPLLAGGPMTWAGLAMYGAGGAGNVRQQVAQRRQEGQDISGTKEAVAAFAEGALEVFSGLITRGIAKTSGAALKGVMEKLSPRAVEGILNIFKTQGRTAGKKAIGRMIRQYAGKQIPAAAGEALEEGFTQVAQNLVASKTYDPERDLMEGSGEAAAMGAAISPLAGGLSNIMSRGGAVTGPSQQVRPVPELGVAQASEEVSEEAPMLADNEIKAIEEFQNNPNISDEAKAAAFAKITEAVQAGEQIDIGDVLMKISLADSLSLAQQAQQEPQPVPAPTTRVSAQSAQTEQTEIPADIAPVSVETTKPETKPESPEYTQFTKTEQAIEDTEQAIAAARKTGEEKATIESNTLELLKQSAETDSMTGLLNHGGYQRAAKKVYGWAEENKKPLSVMYVDSINLKAANDLVGHEAGDKLIKIIGEELALTERHGRPDGQNDAAARIGGDEYAITLPGADEAGARAFMDRFKKRLSTRLKREGLEEVIVEKSGEDPAAFLLGASAGIASTDFSGGKSGRQTLTLNQLKSQAESNMNKAKEAEKEKAASLTGRGKVEEYQKKIASGEAKAKVRAMEQPTKPTKPTEPAAMPETTQPEIVPPEKAVAAYELLKTADPDAKITEPTTQADKNAKAFAEARGLQVVHVTSDKVAGARVGNVIFLSPGMNEQSAWEAVIHEATHAKGFDTKLQRGLNQKDQALLEQAEKDYISLLYKSLGENHSKVKQLLDSPEDLRREGIAYMAGQAARNPAYRKRLQQHPTLYARIVEAIRATINKIKGESRFVDNLVKQFMEDTQDVLLTPELIRKRKQAESRRTAEQRKREAQLKATREKIKAGKVDVSLTERQASARMDKALADDLDKETVNWLYNPRTQVKLQQRASEGDEAAITDLHTAVVGLLRKQAYHLNPNHAEDLFQIGMEDVTVWSRGQALKKWDPQEKTIVQELARRTESRMKAHLVELAEQKKLVGPLTEEHQAVVGKEDNPADAAEAHSVLMLVSDAMNSGKTNAEIANDLEIAGLGVVNPSMIDAIRERLKALDLLPNLSILETPKFQRIWDGLESEAKKPKLFFHGSVHPDVIGSFLPASHFGTMMAAIQNLENKKPGLKYQTAFAAKHDLFTQAWVEDKANGVSVYPVYINVNPKKIVGPTSDYAANQPLGLVEWLLDHGKINPKQYGRFQKLGYANEARLRTDARLARLSDQYYQKDIDDLTELEQQHLRHAYGMMNLFNDLKNMGLDYEAVAYYNDHEDKGSISYMVPDPRKIISAITGEPILSMDRAIDFLPKNPNSKQAVQDIIKLFEQASKEKPGSKTIGDPALANIGVDQARRSLINALQQQRINQGQPKTETFDEWDRNARKILKTPEGEADIRKKLVSGKIDSATESRAAQILWNNQALKGLQNTSSQDFKEAVKLGNGWLAAGTQAGRLLTSRRDSKQTPTQRLSEFIGQQLGHLPGKAKQKYDEAIAKDDTAGAEKIIDDYTEAVMKIVKTWEEQGINLADVDRVIQNHPEILNKIIHDVRGVVTEHGWWSPIQEYYRNSIMFSPLTLIRNVLGGGYALGDILVVKPVQRQFRRLLGENVSGETAAVVQTLLSKSTWAMAWRNMADSLLYEEPAFENILQRQGAVEDIEVYLPPAITGKAVNKIMTSVFGSGVGKAAGKTVNISGHIVRIPQRINAAVDQFVKTVHAHAMVAAEAIQLGKAAGIDPAGSAMTDYVDEQIGNWGSESWALAMDKGETYRVTFMAESGMVEKMILKLRKSVPMLGLLFPFVKTPVQIAKQVMISSPLGAAYMATRGVKQLAGTKRYSQDEFTRHAAQQLIAWAAASMIWNWMDDEDEPVITGPISYTKGMRQEALARQQKYPSMSWRIRDKWYSYRNIEPFSTAIGAMVAGIEELKQTLRNGQPITQSVSRAWAKIYGMFSDQTYLRAVGDMMKIAQDSDEYTMERLARNTLSGFIPNFIDNSMRARDRFIREKRPMGEKGERPDFLLQLRREALPTGEVLPPPKVDIWGRDVEAYGGRLLTPFINRFLWPFTAREDKREKGDKILGMLIRYNDLHPDLDEQKWPIEMGRTVVVDSSGIKPKTEQLNEHEYYLASKLSGLLSKKMIEKHDWNYTTPTLMDIRRIENIWETARASAREFVAGARKARYYGRDETYERIMAKLRRKVSDMEGAKK